MTQPKVFRIHYILVLKCIKLWRYVFRSICKNSYSTPDITPSLIPMLLFKQWTLERVSHNAYHLVSAWGSSTGYLTRKGNPVGGGNYQPSNQVQIMYNGGWNSQEWYFWRI